MSFVKDTMNIYPTQSSQIFYTEPQTCSSAVMENFSSLEDLERDSPGCLVLEPSGVFSGASSLDQVPNTMHIWVVLVITPTTLTLTRASTDTSEYSFSAKGKEEEDC
ncbi:uncharacterized protein [Penaeus vannamei]|uniref:uncharacterized protein n=1 Tax=Penaeus vannamei TaxID=6689 RepID=UPI000F682674|nr:uncharacterized protein LOC113820668 [Penaeus vannamei]